MCVQCRDEACKQAEADAEASRSRLRLERAAWERADADARAGLNKLREEWRMLQEVNAGLHSNIARLDTALQVSQSWARHAICLELPMGEIHLWAMEQGFCPN